MDSPSTSTLPSLAPVGSTSYDHPDLSPNQAPFTDAQVDEYREQDRWLPIANVARIMKNSLPTNAKISKEAKECVQECVSEFISFITSEAADKCLTEKRKTINGEDILTSMRTLGFDNYETVLKIYLAKYREHQLSQAQKRPGEPDDEVGEDGKRKRKRSGGGAKRKNTQNSVASLDAS